MPSRFLLSVTIFVASILIGVFLIIDGVAVELSWLRLLSPVITISMLLLSAFDLFLWKILPDWLIKRPKIYGTWKGVIKSNWTDRNTNEQIQPIECYVAIRQTFSQLSFRQMTAESSSTLINGKVFSLRDNVYQIGGIYCNEPKLLLRKDSPIHYGGQLLTVIGRPATSLDGEYWTDRNTAGQLEFTERKKKILHDFQSAKAFFNSG